MHRLSWLLLLGAAGAAGCGETDPGGPDDSASVVGTVLAAETDTPLEGADVSAGGAATTTDPQGRFELTGVPAGASATIRSERPGFVAYSAAITIQAGTNTHNIRMTRQTLYQEAGVAIHIPANVQAVRGVLLSLGGFDRGIATGVFDGPDPGINASQTLSRQQPLQLASRYGLALVGADLRTPRSDTRIFGALDGFAVSSARPELSHAPLLIHGISAGAPETYALALQYPERIIGFTLIIPATPSSARSAATQRVPAYVVLGEEDVIVSNDLMIAHFEANRSEGALWSLAIEPGVGHAPMTEAARALIGEWMDAILSLRLPPGVTPGTPVALQAIQESSGWLGDRATFAIAAYASFAGDKQLAAWLPAETGAEQWRDFVTPE